MSFEDSKYTFGINSLDVEYRLKEIITSLFYEQSWFVSSGQVRDGTLLTVNSSAFTNYQSSFGIASSIANTLRRSEFRDVYSFYAIDRRFREVDFRYNGTSHYDHPYIPIAYTRHGTALLLRSVSKIPTTSSTGIVDGEIRGGLGIRQSSTDGIGTLGIVIKKEGRNIVLTNKHVLGHLMYNEIVDLLENAELIGHARYLDGMLGDISFGGRIFTYDAAIAYLEDEVKIRTNYIESIGEIKNLLKSVNYDQGVIKFGASSGLTRGKIFETYTDVKINFKGVNNLYRNQISVLSDGPFQLPGDSGSILIADGDCSVIGLLHSQGEDTSTAYATPWPVVSNALDISL